jgi:hypothetical protein
MSGSQIAVPDNVEDEVDSAVGDKSSLQGSDALLLDFGGTVNLLPEVLSVIPAQEELFKLDVKRDDLLIDLSASSGASADARNGITVSALPTVEVPKSYVPDVAPVVPAVEIPIPVAEVPNVPQIEIPVTPFFTVEEPQIGLPAVEELTPVSVPVGALPNVTVPDAVYPLSVTCEAKSVDILYDAAVKTGTVDVSSTAEADLVDSSYSAAHASPAESVPINTSDDLRTTALTSDFDFLDKWNALRPDDTETGFVLVNLTDVKSDFAESEVTESFKSHELDFLTKDTVHESVSVELDKSALQFKAMEWPSEGAESELAEKRLEGDVSSKWIQETAPMNMAELQLEAIETKLVDYGVQSTPVEEQTSGVEVVITGQSWDVPKLESKESWDVSKLESRQSSDFSKFESKQSSDVPELESKQTSDVLKLESKQLWGVPKLESKQLWGVPKLESKESWDVSKLESKQSSDFSKFESKQSSDVPELESKQTSDVSKFESKQPSDVLKLESKQLWDVPKLEGKQSSDFSKFESKQSSNVPKLESEQSSNVSKFESKQPSNVLKLESKQSSDVSKPASKEAKDKTEGKCSTVNASTYSFSSAANAPTEVFVQEPSANVTIKFGSHIVDDTRREPSWGKQSEEAGQSINERCNTEASSTRHQEIVLVTSSDEIPSRVLVSFEDTRQAPDSAAEGHNRFKLLKDHPEEIEIQVEVKVKSEALPCKVTENTVTRTDSPPPPPVPTSAIPEGTVATISSVKADTVVVTKTQETVSPKRGQVEEVSGKVGTIVSSTTSKTVSPDTEQSAEVSSKVPKEERKVGAVLLDSEKPSAVQPVSAQQTSRSETVELREQSRRSTALREPEKPAVSQPASDESWLRRQSSPEKGNRENGLYDNKATPGNRSSSYVRQPVILTGGG